MFETLRQDVRFALRVLAARPGFSIAAILTLALGIGANATLYSLVNAVLFKAPPAVHQPDRLVALYTSDYSGPPYGASAYADYEDFRQLPVFSDGLAMQVRATVVGEEEARDRVGTDVVTPNYFSVLGVQPYRGSFFPRTGPAGGVVISYALWQRLGANDVGTLKLRVNGTVQNVLGVTPPEFNGIMPARAVDLWVTHDDAALLALGNDAESRASRGSRSYLVYARLADGVDQQRAQAALNVLAERLLKAYPENWTDRSGAGRRISLLSERASRVPAKARGPILGFTGVLFVTVGIVLLICCSNVAGLMLARASGRARELAIRASMGATSGRIVRQLLTEAVLLSLAGGAVGVLAALWASDWIAQMQMPVPIPLRIDVSPDGRVLLFSFIVTAFAAILFGLLPALRVSRPDVTAVLKGDLSGVRLLGRRRVTLRDALVVSQLSLSLLLLVGCLLFLRSVRAATALTPGFPTQNLTLIDLGPEPGVSGEIDPAKVLQIRDQIAALPGVQAVSWADAVPLSFDITQRGMRVRGYEAAPSEDMEFAFNMVGPGYLTMIGLPLVRGRDFEATDRAGAPTVAIVNETFARRYFGTRDPLTAQLSYSGPEGPWVQVIGVARDGKYASLGEAPRPYVYFSSLQEMWGATLHIRSSRDPASLASAIDPIVRQTATGWISSNARSFESHVGQSLLPQRIGSSVLGLFGFLALLLAAIGLYASIAIWVAQRTREFGVRMALGANASEVVRVVLNRGGRLVVFGLAIGLAGAWVVSRFLRFLLVGVSTADPLAFGGAAILLGIVAVLALALPALRASRLDPLDALKSS
jgi:predicted permease